MRINVFYIRAANDYLWDQTFHKLHHIQKLTEMSCRIIVILILMYFMVLHDNNTFNGCYFIHYSTYGSTTTNKKS